MLHGRLLPPTLLRLLGLALVLGVAACSSTPDPAAMDPADGQEIPVAPLYNEAMDLLERGKYEEAARQFDEVERLHPYSVWATKAQLMAAYAHYQDNDYTSAIVALDRYIRLHPGNQDVAYAYYLKALCYYEQISDVGRDQKITDDARAALTQVITRFPDSPYARDARLKLDLTENHLAGKQMDIGRFYLRRKYYLAAINRFKDVVTQYQTTSHVPEALHRLTEAYLALGLTEEARRAAAVLGYNFPGSEWYQDSYRLLVGDPGGREEGSRSWLGWPF